MTNNLMTLQEVSEFLSIKESTIYQWTHQRKIPHVKVGRFLRFEEQKIEAWLIENQIDPV